jgi:hypothetical protein
MALVLEVKTGAYTDTSSQYDGFKTFISTLQTKYAVMMYADYIESHDTSGDHHRFLAWSIDFRSEVLIWMQTGAIDASAKPSTFDTDFPAAVQSSASVNTPLWG